MKTILSIMLVVLITILFAGCKGTYVVSSQPAPPVYVRPVAPHPGYVWIDGNWYWRGGGYVYRQGHWAPPGRRAYVPGHWQQRRNGWYWHRGGWRR